MDDKLIVIQIVVFETYSLKSEWNDPVKGKQLKVCVYVCVYVCVFMCVFMCILIHIWLFVIAWTVAQQVPLSMEFSRQEY